MQTGAIEYLPKQERLNQLNYYVSSIRYMVNINLKIKDIKDWLAQKGVKVSKKDLEQFIDGLNLPINDAARSQQMAMNEAEEKDKIKEEIIEKKETKIETCPKCSSEDIVKNGKLRGEQRYLCKKCGKQFTGPLLDEPTETPQNTDINKERTEKLHPEIRKILTERNNKPITIEEVENIHKEHPSVLYNVLLNNLTDEGHLIKGKKGTKNIYWLPDMELPKEELEKPKENITHEINKDRVYSRLKNIILKYNNKPISIVELRVRDKTFNNDSSYRDILNELIEENKVKRGKIKTTYYYWPIEIENQIKIKLNGNTSESIKKSKKSSKTKIALEILPKLKNAFRTHNYGMDIDQIDAVIKDKKKSYLRILCGELIKLGHLCKTRNNGIIIYYLPEKEPALKTRDELIEDKDIVDTTKIANEQLKEAKQNIKERKESFIPEACKNKCVWKDKEGFVHSKCIHIQKLNGLVDDLDKRHTEKRVLSEKLTKENEELLGIKEHYKTLQANNSVFIRRNNNLIAENKQLKQELDQLKFEVTEKVTEVPNLALRSDNETTFKEQLESKKLDLLKMFAAEEPLPAIIEWLNTWKISVTYDALIEFKKEHESEIKALEKIYKTGIAGLKNKIFNSSKDQFNKTDIYGILGIKEALWENRKTYDELAAENKQLLESTLTIDKPTNNPIKIQLKNGKLEYDFVKIDSRLYNRLLADREYLENKIKAIKHKEPLVEYLQQENELSEIFDIPDVDIIFNARNQESFLWISKTLNDYAIDFEIFANSKEGKHAIIINSKED